MFEERKKKKEKIRNENRGIENLENLENNKMLIYYVEYIIK